DAQPQSTSTAVKPTAVGRREPRRGCGVVSISILFFVTVKSWLSRPSINRAIVGARHQRVSAPTNTGNEGQRTFRTDGQFVRIDLSDATLEEESRARACIVLTLGAKAQGIKHRRGDLTDADSLKSARAAATQLTYGGRKGLTGALTPRPHRRTGSWIEE